MGSDASISRRLDVARALISQKKPQQALQVNSSLRLDHPHHPGVLTQASRIHALLGHYRQARQFALDAFHVREHCSELQCRLLLLHRLQVFHLTREIRELASEALDSDESQPPWLDAISTVLNQFNMPELALEVLCRGLAKSGTSAELLLSRAQTLMFLGRFDEAECDLEACLSVRPAWGFAWWLRTQLPRAPERGDFTKKLQSFLELRSLPPQDRVCIAYALHRELNRLGEIEKSAEALALACRTKRQQLDYRSAETQALFSLLKAQHFEVSEPLFERARTPIFIVGMHRSGTTLLEQFLAGHSEIRALGELYDFSAQMRLATDYPCKGVIDPELIRFARAINFQSVGAGYLESVSWRLGSEKFFTDKLPSNFLNIGFILSAIPHAKILHVTRDPIETCFSNLRELFANGTNPYSYDQVELAEYYHEYRALMTHWHEAFPGRIHDVEYSRITTEPVNTLREVAQYCGFSFEPMMLELNQVKRSVSTASMVQVRNELSSRNSSKWIAYADHLVALREALDQPMKVGCSVF